MIKKMVRKNSKKNREIQRHMDLWADLMTRIMKNPEIADRIPNNANLLFSNDGEVIFINGEPRHYSELVKVQRKKKTAKSKRQRATAIAGS